MQARLPRGVGEHVHGGLSRGLPRGRAWRLPAPDKPTLPGRHPQDGWRKLRRKLQKTAAPRTPKHVDQETATTLSVESTR
jgi:hypothetical protein